MLRFLCSRAFLVSAALPCAMLGFSMGGCPMPGESGDVIVDEGAETGEDTDSGLDSGGSSQSGGGAVEPPPNEPPTVDAGPDQSVEGGVSVLLTASGSDPDGDPLTYSWTQLSGEPITLADADTATPSFTAPMVSGTMEFRVTVDDGLGGSASDMVAVEVSVEAVLFIANYLGNNITSYYAPQTVIGNIAPDTNLAGAATQIVSPADIVIDAAGALGVANFGANAIRCYEDAETANGNFAPDRNVVGAATQLAGPASMAIQMPEDLLFASNYLGAPDSIAVFSDASSAMFNGNLAPTRLFTSASISDPSGINLDSQGTLYVVSPVLGSVAAFADADSLNGPVAATRIINSADFAGHVLFDVFVDLEDRLYVLAQDGFVFIFEDASTLSGMVSPSFVLQISGAIVTTAIVVDRSGIGYVADYGAHTIYSFDDIATLNGLRVADRVISGASTQLVGPIRLFLWER